MTALSHQDDGQAGHPDSQLVDQNRPAAVSAAGPRDWIKKPSLQGLLALLIYLVVWIPTAVRPLVHHSSWAQLDQASMDPNFYAWCLRWWPFAIGHGHNPLFTHEIGAPAGHALAWVTTVPPIALLASPLTLAAGPVVAFNLLSAVALPVAAWSAFLLCRRLTKKFWPAMVGGAVFGFSAYEMNHGAAGQLNLTYSLLIPILAYLVVVWREESIKSRTFVILAGLTMAVQFYLFLETFADMTAIIAVSLLLGFALAGQAGRPELVRLAKLVGIAYAGAVALALPYIGYALTTKPPKLTAVTGLDLASLVVPRRHRTLGLTWLAHLAAHPIETSAAGYVGVPLLILAILFAVTGWSSKIVRFLSIMLAFIIVAAIGPVVYVDGHRAFRLPWAPFFHLPIVRNAYPSRLMLFAFLVLAVVTALWLAGPAKRLWARWPLAILVLAAIILDAPAFSTTGHTNVPAFISKGQYQRNLSRGETVVVVSTVGNAGMLWQAEADFYMRLAGGFINAGLSHRTDLPRPVQDLSAATPARVTNFQNYVRSSKVGAILVDAAHEPLWIGIFSKMGLHGHRIGDVIVIPINGCQTCKPLTPSQIG